MSFDMRLTNVPTKRRHVHKYHRIKLKSNKDIEVYACAYPNCSHYTQFDFVLNKLSICHRCGGEFILTRDLLKLKKPHCLDCTKTKSRPKIDAITKLLEGLNAGTILKPEEGEKLEGEYEFQEGETEEDPFSE